MAQFDIHRNPSPRSSASRPFVLVIQSARYDRISTRLVAALGLKSALPEWDATATHLTPKFVVAERDVYLNPFELTNILADRLGAVVASLAEDEDAKRQVQKALDAVLAQY